VSSTENSPQLHTGKFYGLDHLRAFAIAFVFMFHYQIGIFGHPEWVPVVSRFGWTGVDLFFVLSGFLISSHLFAQIAKAGSISYKEFFLKRFFRIIPAYLVIVAIYFCVPAFHERESLPPLWRFLTFTQNIGLDIQHSGTFSHAWSLCVEEHFYLLLPIVLFLLLAMGWFRRAWWFLPLLFILGIALRHYSWMHFYLPDQDSENSYLPWYQYIYYPTYNRLDGLLAGVSIAALYQFLPAVFYRIAAYGNLLFVASIAVLTGAYFLCAEQATYAASVFGFPMVALGYGFMVLSAISPSSFLYRFKSGVTTYIAMLSYGIYLSHKGVIHITQGALAHFGMDISSNVVLLICIAACILAAALLHVTIEKPFIWLREKIKV
jgi:peptidoglycan/LPS O-acetylase OafA/YrhL